MYGPLDWDRLEWELVVPGIKRKVIHFEGGTLVLNHLDPGNEPFPHDHPHEQISYIISGELDFTIAEVVHRLVQGDLLSVPPEATHYAVAVGDEPCLNLDFFIPRREDYQASQPKTGSS